MNLPYTNAKVIYRVFREENRVTSNARYKQNMERMSEGSLIKHAYIMRQNALRKLLVALSNGSMTICQRTKIYDHNFDEFFSKPILAQLEHEGICFLGDKMKQLVG